MSTYKECVKELQRLDPNGLYSDGAYDWTLDNLESGIDEEADKDEYTVDGFSGEYCIYHVTDGYIDSVPALKRIGEY